MAVLRNCCCCFPLRRGTVTLGVMGFTGAVTAVITLILGFIFVETVVDWVVALLGMVVSLPASRGTKHLTEEEQEADIQKFREELIYAYSTYVFVGALIANVIGAVISAGMVFGAVKKRPKFLVPWLIMGLTVITGNVVCLILCCVFLPTKFALTLFFVGLFQVHETSSWTQCSIHVFLLGRLRALFSLNG